MDFKNIIYEKKDTIAKITLNRPEKMNALSNDLQADLRVAFDDCENDQNIRCLIITGAGRAFSAGFDLTPGQHREEPPSTARWDGTHLAPRTLMRPWYLRQPVIAAVNGFALAAGNVLAQACDIVVASEDAMFGEPEIRHGAHSPFTILPYLIPQRQLAYFYYVGDIYDARTAEKWNLVTKVVPAAKLQDEAMHMAQRISMVIPFSVQMMKRSLRQVYDKMGFSAAFDHHLALRMLGGLVPNVPEKINLTQIRETKGMKAFLEARDGPLAKR